MDGCIALPAKCTNEKTENDKIFVKRAESMEQPEKKTDKVSCIFIWGSFSCLILLGTFYKA
jgi:hypothetical protein